jgi:uncharacterized membrane protein
MAMGPTQLLIVLGLDRHGFDEALLSEFERLRAEEIVRVLDVLAVERDANGEVVVRQLGDADTDVSIDADCGVELLEEIPSGSSATLVLLEHHWAWRLHEVVAALRGFGIGDGFVICPVDRASVGAAGPAVSVRAGRGVAAGLTVTP